MNIKITVMSFSDRPGAQSYFVGVDDQRVVFFDKLRASCALPYAKFTVIRNDGIFDTADAGFSGGVPMTIEVSGFKNLRPDHESVENWVKKIREIYSFYFLPGDVIEIDWNIDESDEQFWLSKLSIDRRFGASFETVFKGRDSLIKTALEKIGHSYQEVLTKNVIFTSSPFDAEDLKKYY